MQRPWNWKTAAGGISICCWTFITACSPVVSCWKQGYFDARAAGVTFELMHQWHYLNGSATRANASSKGSEPGLYGTNSELAISLVATEVGQGVERLHTGINLSIDFPAWETLQPLAAT